jgi:ABC-type nickel/cobalt efflux system permease component RcnA
MIKKIHRLLLLVAVILITVQVLTPAAAAHPLGNFTINHYAGLQVQPDAITIDYVLDMAEIPAFQEISTFDANRNGQPDNVETDRYHPAQCTAIKHALELRLDGRPLNLSLESLALEFPAGSGGLLTLRLTCSFRASLTVLADKAQIEFKNKAYPDRLGWREIVVTGQGVSMQGDLPAMPQSLSQRLTVYPNDLLTNPLDQREITFQVTPSAGVSVRPLTGSQISGQPPVNRNDGFTQLITIENLSLLTFLLTLMIAFAWGAAHALTPGHGKTIVAAYLVGSRGTSRHAFFLGLTTTVTHTAGVFALGFLTMFASQFILPEQLYPWLGVASGILVITIGWSLLQGRLRQLLRRGHQLHNYNHHHPHSHDHHPVGHDHHHPHSHNHGDGHSHSHLPPGADGTPLTWRSLLALGISGGLIPCPSALVVMLSAIALERIGFGLVLIVAFSLGLASVLTLIGLLWVHAGRLFSRAPVSGPLFRVTPVLSALFITVVGLGITLQALGQTGLLPVADWVGQVANVSK